MNSLHNAKLDWITQDPEAVVARHARVSTKNPDRAEFEKLLTFCINEGHWSIFEQVCASFEIVTSRAISAQIIRHRSFHYQELSQRYCAPDKVLDDAWDNCWDFELRAQDFKDRQNSFEFGDETVKEVLKQRIKEVFSEIEDVYQTLLESGVARECARNILPMCTPTKLHMQGTLRDWIFYVGLRGANGTQKEHKYIAHDIGRALSAYVPTSIKALLRSDNPAVEGWRVIENLEIG